MATDLTFNSANFTSKYGGLYWGYRRCNADGTELASPDTWHVGTYRVKSDFEFGQALNPLYGEDGSQIASQPDVVKTTWKITTPDDGVETEKFLKEETAGTFFKIVMDAGSVSGSLRKYRFFGIARIETDYKTSSPGREPIITIVPQFNGSSVTMTGLSAGLSSTWSTYPTTLSTVTVPAGYYYSISAA